MLDLVDHVQRGSYQLSKSGTTKLRKLTRDAGLATENIASRLALAASIREPLPEDPSTEAGVGGKEIKGLTLLGKKRSAALLIALIARNSGGTLGVDEIKNLVRFHWERGLTILVRETSGADAVSWMAKQVVPMIGVAQEVSREEVAKAVGREFGRWPVEVRRLVANAGHLSVSSSLDVARQLAAAVEELYPGRRVSEAVAISILRDEWGINRLGLGPEDRTLLERVAAAGETGLDLRDVSRREAGSVTYMRRIGLLCNGPRLVLTAETANAGAKMWSLL